MPDALTDAASIEIKDAIYVSATRQLRIQTEAADILGKGIDIDYRNENENKR